ncbi:MAG: TonB-dependent receptor [bacterium]
MKKISTKLLVFCLLAMISDFAYGQGILRGVVTDSLENSPLWGANVIVMGTALGDATDFEGHYRVTGIPEGNYVLKVSYIGYESKDFNIKIEDGKTLELSTSLSPDVIEGLTVIVTGQAEGQVAAINQQITSNTIINVISEEKIQELPDANAAESIGRLPGVALQRSGGEANKVVLRGLSDKFSNITVDGIKIAPTDADDRGVDLSTISQGSLAGIELYKALTPDMDADAIAGSVNLVTKKAPSERVLRLDSRGAYNDLNNTLKQYDFQLRYGERFFDELFGVQVTANIEQRDRSKEDFDLSYNQNLNSGQDWEITDFELTFTDEIRKRGGFGLLLDFNTPDGGYIKLNNIFNQTSRDYIEYHRNYPTDPNNQLLYGARDREQKITTFNSALIGENYLLGFTANWSASFAQSNSDFPFDYDVTFTEPSSLDSEGNPVSGMSGVPEDVLKGPYESIINYALNNFQKSYLYTAYYRDEYNFDKERTATLNLKTGYTIGNYISGEVKFGGKYKAKTRYRSRSELLSPYYNESFAGYVKMDDGTVVPKNFDGTPFTGIFDALGNTGGKILVTYFLDPNPENRNIYDKYSLYPLMNRDAIRQWWDLNKNGFNDADGKNPEYERNFEADAFYYDINETISSGYLMNTLNFGQEVTLITGIRAEVEANEYRSRYSINDLSGFPTPKGNLRDTTATHYETVWLPNFHLSYRPTDFMLVRLAAYKALARPDFNHRLENFVARKAGTFYSGNSLTIGNPGLKAASAWNFEINTSFFGNTIGLFSISAFYKDIKDMYHMINGIFIDGDHGQSTLDSLGINYNDPFTIYGYNLVYPYNSSKPTKVWGLEIEHQTNLRFLPGILSNIVLSYNFSLVRSETYVATSRTDTVSVTVPGIPFPILKPVTVLYENKTKLEGQPEFFGNFALGYDIGGFSGRISLFYNGSYNRTFSANGRSDNTVDEFMRLDIALKQQITDYLSVMLNLNNITNTMEDETIKNRITGWSLLNNSQIYGFTADLGVRLTL